MVLALEFYTKGPDALGDAANILLSPDLYLVSDLEAALLAYHWGAVIISGTLTFFADTSTLMDGRMPSLSQVGTP